MSNDTIYSVHIDWLTLTVKGGFNLKQTIGDEGYARQIAQSCLCDFGVIVPSQNLFALRPVFGYAYGYSSSETGLQVHVGGDIEQQGVMLIATGQALANGRNGQQLLGDGLALGWKPTRIDVAFNFQNSGSSVQAFRDDYVFVHEGAPKRKTQLISSRSGDTFTIGSRTSEKYVRVYDKAAEQGIDGDWKRVEIELKGLAAIEYAQDIADSPSAASVLITPMLGIMGNTIAVMMGHIAGGYDPARPVSRPETLGNKLLWLQKSVIPSLVTMYYADAPQFEKFRELLNKAIEDGASPGMM